MSNGVKNSIFCAKVSDVLMVYENETKAHFATLNTNTENEKKQLQKLKFV